MTAPAPFRDEEIFAWLDAQYVPQLRNLNVIHPKLLVLFSGPPSSGKSTIAHALETEFQGLRLENDVIRTLLVAQYPQLPLDKRAQLTYDYSVHLQEKLIGNTQNGLWIIDSSVDRAFQEFYSFAEKYHFATVLIAMDIPIETHKQWIIAGGDRPFRSVGAYLELMPQRRAEQAVFLQAHQPDLTVRPGYDMGNIIASVRGKLDNIS